ncbi:hypothetical protein [Nocardia aurantia]|uniref:PPE family domain-containing protein n=1 Tax=Nocardia aurantia TaxID=2585199 RepID=A0A7K0DL55_9NOCA|nr:hypothetical protein [Nocardia aurantia]MQY26515.1 hypothetical protein [Nocardia aurantia]
MTSAYRHGQPGSRASDPEYISAMEHFEGIPHEQIYAGTQQIDAARIVAAAQVWVEAAGTVSTSMPLTRTTADDLINAAGWEGAAAEAAYAGTRGFAASVDELATVLGEVGARLGAVAAAAEAVKLAVAPPGDSGPIGAIARALEATGVINARMAQETIRQEAVLAMNMIYKPAYSAAGSHVPALPDLPQTGSAAPGSGHQSRPSTPSPAPEPPESPVTPPNSEQPPVPSPAPRQPSTPDHAPAQPPTTQTPSPAQPPTSDSPAPAPTADAPPPAQPPTTDASPPPPPDTPPAQPPTADAPQPPTPDAPPAQPPTADTPPPAQPPTADAPPPAQPPTADASPPPTPDTPPAQPPTTDGPPPSAQDGPPPHTPEPAPSQQLPPPTHVPDPSTPLPAPPPPPQPAPAPVPPPPDPAPGQSIPAGPPLSDQGGQPGITGPIPDDTAAPAPDQPGVIPPGG